MLIRSAMTRVSKRRIAGVGKATANLAPNILMWVAVKLGWSNQKVIAAEFMGTELGSWRACDAIEANDVLIPLVVVGK